MSGILIHDGRRPGHRKWVLEAISRGDADGAFINPFATPRVSKPRHPSASEFAQDVFKAGGEVLFDPMTHVAFLPSTNRIDFYSDWKLFGTPNPSLEDKSEVMEHVERVFKVQDKLCVPHLAPSVKLTSPLLSDAYLAIEMAEIASSIDPGSYQSLVGGRSFWSAGSDLDAYIGELSSLHSPTWVVTVANEIVPSNALDLTDIDAFTGLLRSVHSLSLRSRVIVAFSDFAGLLSVAAGADTVGSGWDRGQRVFDPLSFREASDNGIRIPASYVTQGALKAVLRRDTADAIERWDPTEAARMRGGPMPKSDQAERMHHLAQLRLSVLDVDKHGSNRERRVASLRSSYQSAADDFDILSTNLPGSLSSGSKDTWVGNAQRVLDSYAASEGF